MQDVRKCRDQTSKEQSIRSPTGEGHFADPSRIGIFFNSCEASERPPKNPFSGVLSFADKFKMDCGWREGMPARQNSVVLLSFASCKGFSLEV
jgi:hypothetical protein